MKITIAAVGKLKEEYLKEAVSSISKGIMKHCDFEIIEIPDEKNDELSSPAAVEAVKNKEGALLLKKIKPSQYLIALAIDGTPLDTRALGKHIIKCKKNEKDDIVFVIGGSLGLSNEVLSRADFKLSFSPMTFPHQLMRIILMEQIYFAIK